MKKTPMVLLGVACAVCALLAMDRLHARGAPPAPKAAPMSVGVCDVVTILTQYERVIDVKAKFNARGADILALQKLKTKDIESARKFLRDEFKPDTPDYEKQLAKIREMMIELEVWEKIQAGANRRDEYVTTLALHKEVIAAVGDEAVRRGLDLVLHSRDALQPAATADAPDRLRIQPVLYAAERVDVTGEVLKKLNDDYKKRKDK